MNGKITLCAARGTILIVVVHSIKPVLIYNEHKEGNDCETLKFVVN